MIMEGICSMKKPNKLLSGLILGKTGWILAAAVLFLNTSCGKNELSITSGDTETIIAAEEKAESDREEGQEADEGSELEEGQEADEGSELEGGQEADEGSDTESGENADSDGMVYVYICGAVTKEGVYSLPNGSRVQDALEKAGGYSEDAEKGYINLARVLIDGEKIYFPTMDEAGNLSVSEKIDNQKYTNQDVYGNINSGDSSGNPDGATDNDSDAFGDKRININTAGKEELMTLSGIGESKAEDIISYRERIGKFSSIEDIKNVSGIGDSTFERIKESIMVN